MVILVATCGVPGADEYPPHAPSAITDVRSNAETDRIGDLHHRAGFHHKENPLDVQERRETSTWRSDSWCDGRRRTRLPLPTERLCPRMLFPSSVFSDELRQRLATAGFFRRQ